MSNLNPPRPFDEIDEDVDFDIDFLQPAPGSASRPDALAGGVEPDEVSADRPPEWGLPSDDEPTEWVTLDAMATPEPAAAPETSVEDDLAIAMAAINPMATSAAQPEPVELAAEVEPDTVEVDTFKPKPLTIPAAMERLLPSFSNLDPLPPLSDPFEAEPLDRPDAMTSVIPDDPMLDDTLSELAPVSDSFADVADTANAWTNTFSALATHEHAEVAAVPRIAIHVFAERQDTLAAAERAGQDRRLSRATTQIRVGGVQAAIDAYRNEPTPPLIIVESPRDPQGLLEDVDQLANVCDAGTKVIVIGAMNDIILFRELMRRGVSEYLVAPVQPLQLISAIGGLFADPAQPFIGRTVAFVGARGGAGASVVAHNTAYAISERIGANAVIVDYDLPFGTAGLDFNQDPVSGVADALSQPDRLDAVLLDRMVARCTDKLSLFAAPATLDNDWDISPDVFEEVTNRIRSTAPFVVLDLPHLWSGWMKKTLISADEVVVVATPDLASLRNAKNIVDLVKQARPNDAPPRLVLNQVGVPGRPEIPAKEFGDALGIHPSLSIPFDAKLFGAAANNGQMILDAGAKSKPAESFQTLAEIVTRREAPQTAKVAGKPAKEAGTSLLAGLFKKKAL